LNAVYLNGKDPKRFSGVKFIQAVSREVGGSEKDRTMWRGDMVDRPVMQEGFGVCYMQ
jgi:hypothetical protein